MHHELSNAPTVPIVARTSEISFRLGVADPKGRSAQAIRNERMTFSQALRSSHTRVQTLAVLPARQEPRGDKGEEILPVLPVRNTQESLVRVELGLSVALSECCRNPVWLMVAELAEGAVIRRELNCCSVYRSCLDDDCRAVRSISKEVPDSPEVRLVSGEVEAAADPRGNHCLDPSSSIESTEFATSAR